MYLEYRIIGSFSSLVTCKAFLFSTIMKGFISFYINIKRKIRVYLEKEVFAQARGAKQLGHFAMVIQERITKYKNT